MFNWIKNLRVVRLALPLTATTADNDNVNGGRDDIQSEPETSTIADVTTPKYTSILTITFNDGTTIQWKTKQSTASRSGAYRKFYKWFFSTDKPFFLFKYDTGETMFYRKDIKTFNSSVTDDSKTNSL